LIELLVVIAIIAVLVSLTAAGVMYVLGRGPDIQTRSEIGELEAAIASAKSTWNVPFLPSRLVLYEDMSYPNRNVAGHPEQTSWVFLTKAFGKSAIKQGSLIDWNGNGTIDKPQNGFILEGEHCLVFLLGGIPTPPGGAPGCQGFSTNPANPADIKSGTRPAFFEFKGARLRVGHPGGFLVYTDYYGTGTNPWGTPGMPYVYFSSGRAGNDYNIAPPLGPDCPSVLSGNAKPGVDPPVMPFIDPNKRFINPNGFQIISAGADGKFGRGGLWNPVSGTVNDPFGADDMANFSPNKLGKSAQ